MCRCEKEAGFRGSDVSRLERQAVDVIAAEFAAAPFTWQQLERAGLERGWAGGDLAAALSGLRGRGLAQARTGGDGRARYALTREAFASWHRSEKKPEMRSRDCDCDRLTVETDGTGLQAVMLLLRLLVRIPLEGMKLTQSGDLPKAVRGKLEKELFFPRAAYLGHEALGVGRLTDFLLGFAWNEDLIALREGRIVLSEEGLLQWLSLPVAEAVQKWSAYWRTWSWPEEAPLQHMAVIIEGMNSPDGFTLDDLRKEWDLLLGGSRLSGGSMERDWAVLEERVYGHLIGPLVLAGWLHGDYYTSGQTRYRWSYRGKSDEAGGFRTAVEWFVQNDCEIIVPGVPELHALRFLEETADCLRADAAFVYRVSPNSLKRSFAAGRSGREILLFLEKHAVGGVPGSVRQDVLDGERDWLRKKAKEDQPVGKSGKAGAGLREGRDSRIFGMPSGGADVFSGEEKADRGATVLPGPDDLFPGWRQVPAAWLQTCRSYHPSTRLEIARLALEWNIRIKVSSGMQERLIYPRRLHDTDDGFRIEGREGGEKVEIRLQEWDAMQILLPEMDVSWYDRKHI